MRFQMEITDSQAKAMEKLANDAGFKTQKDLINNALSFFEWAQKKKGWI